MLRSALKANSVCVCLLFSLIAVSQKPPLKIDDLRSWPFLDKGRISDDGKYACYFMHDVPEGKKVLVIQATDNSWKRLFPAAFSDNTDFTRDGRFLIAPKPGDSLSLVSLGTDQVASIANVSYYKLGAGVSGQWLALMSADSTKKLTIRNLKTQYQKEIPGVSDFLFAEGRQQLFFKVRDKEPAIETLQLLDLQRDVMTTLWKGAFITNWIINKDGSKIAFTVQNKKEEPQDNGLWFYEEGMQSPRLLVDRQLANLDSNLIIGAGDIRFSADGQRINFEIQEKPLSVPNPALAKLDVWSYRDLQVQSRQLQLLRPLTFLATVNIGSGKFIRLQHEGETILFSDAAVNDYAIAFKSYGWSIDWNIKAAPKLFSVSLTDGSRQFINTPLKRSATEHAFKFSPDGRWLIYYDRDVRGWISINRPDGSFRNITRDIPAIVYEEFDTNAGTLPPRISTDPAGFVGWIPGDSAALICDNYDIWKVDLTGRRKPVNITNGYGAKNHIRLKPVIYTSYNNTIESKPIKEGGPILLGAFNTATKYNGFYRLVDWGRDPVLLSMSPCITYLADGHITVNMPGADETFIVKAQNSATWLLSRRTPSKARNFFVSNDLKNFTGLSDIQPQQKFNWLTSELLRWKATGGKNVAAVLYKPENFDPRKKYPVIFYYYELATHWLYHCPVPDLIGAQINIPWFVSNGYIVCVPDISYEMGYPGRSALKTLISAANYLSRNSWVDAKHIGICGHSFGGFETDYIVTHSNLFAAAVGSAAKTDLISAYNGMGYGPQNRNESVQLFYEQAQGRIPYTLWERPDLYLENSAVLMADKVTTPLLMMHNAKDYTVPFQHATELFTALRRLGKRAWLLQYDDGNHILGRPADQKDYTIRITQFFDHYLKGAPPPVWMTEGVPARRKGIDTGLELDTSGKKP